MLKPRYLLIWVVISFILLFCACWGIEMASIPSEASQLDTIINIASDMALQGGQGIDDFFVSTNTLDDSSSSGSIVDYEVGTANPLQIWVQDSINDSSYTCYNNIFKVYKPTKSIFHTGVTLEESKGSVFDVLYNTDNLREFAKNTIKVTIDIPYIDGDTIIWVTVPKIALMGSEMVFEDEDNYKSLISGLSDIYDTYSVAYGWKALEQNSYTVTEKTGYNGVYYLTPSKLGISYVNKDLVEFLYQNNIDLLMRAKFSTGDGGDDIRVGNGLVDYQFVPQSDVVVSNIENVNNSVTGGADVVNNGTFAICKSESNVSKVEYMTIDLYDSQYDDIIEQLYGAGVDKIETVGSSYFSTPYVMTAEKLKGKSTATDINGNKLEHSYVTVAKVTFTADVIVPYKTGTFIVWRSVYDDSANNYDELVHKIEGRDSGMTESTKYEYTRYYCVTAE